MGKTHDPIRRKLIKSMGLATGAAALSGIAIAQGNKSESKSKRLLRIAHITDVHIRPEHNAPRRFKNCLEEIKKHKVDFFLNGGDTIYAADYDNITRERVLAQWEIWNELRSDFSEYNLYSCLGNHDMWWAAPEKTDPMYGKDYVVEQLKMPSRYYSFDDKGWHFIVLDSNNGNGGSLDDDQLGWLDKDLNNLAKGIPILIMSHYPILGVCTHIDGGNHTDSKFITKLLHNHPDKNINCISGHVHLLDRAVYNNVNYFCNGALSGFWWEEGNKESAGKSWYHETPPGYAIIELFDDGSISNTYFPHSF
tara:strand:+ start:8899 stop:9822 length:924 start_codon:yes stop_codon:yes gene_type:complete